MAKDKDRKKQAPTVIPAPESAGARNRGMAQFWPPLALLLLALIAAFVAYEPSLSAGWFYDDNDYVLLDPRIDHPELFLPWHWHDTPPSLERPGQPTLVIPGYEKPLIADRFLWHLSFALERKFFGPTPSPSIAHGVNLFLHLCCIAMLFLALSNLLRLYLPEDDPASADAWRIWRFLPGAAALFFAVHPWAAEPVCYVSARNGSMGALFTLTGLFCWTYIFETRRHLAVRAAALLGSLVFALMAFGSKENFLVAPAGYVLATAPLIWRKFGAWPKPTRIGLFAGIAAVIVIIGWIGIRNSDRASGLFAQTAGGAGWTYLFEIQSPILLMLLGDEVLARRLTLETNYPGWEVWACWIGILANALLLLWGTVRGFKKPVWLALVWFYIFLIPSNSFLPRPDFLAGRNVYLPTVGAAVLLAGAVLWAVSKLYARAQQNSPGRVPATIVIPIALGFGLCLYFSNVTYNWADGFESPVVIWARSSEVAPDHAVLRLNHAVELFRVVMMEQQAGEDVQSAKQRCEKELHAAIAAEDSQTMRYHTERPKAMVRSIAFQILGQLCQSDQRNKEALGYYRKSWEVANGGMVPPSVATWVQWLSVCDANTVDECMAEGMRVWPNAWWPAAARGLRRLQQNEDRMSSEILEDLQGAERVPNTTDYSLRLLQAEALGRIAMSISDKPRALALVQRLKDLGIPEENVAKVLEKVNAK